MHYLTQRRQSLPDKDAPEQATLVEAALAAGAALAAKTCMVQGAFGYGTELI
jgi:Asp-tRNA(Asn)/Glu-tRNA(Gln) amidotransferase A subunit family amidase